MPSSVISHCVGVQVVALSPDVYRPVGITIDQRAKEGGKNRSEARQSLIRPTPIHYSGTGKRAATSSVGLGRGASIRERARSCGMSLHFGIEGLRDPSGMGATCHPACDPGSSGSFRRFRSITLLLSQRCLAVAGFVSSVLLGQSVSDQAAGGNTSGLASIVTASGWLRSIMIDVQVCPLGLHPCVWPWVRSLDFDWPSTAWDIHSSGLGFVRSILVSSCFGRISTRRHLFAHHERRPIGRTS